MTIRRGPPAPNMGVFPVAAAAVVNQDTFVGIDGSGNVSSELNANDIIGVSTVTVDNTGGAAGDKSVRVDFGVLEVDVTGGAALPGTVVYRATATSVSTSDAGGTRGRAEIVVNSLSATRCQVLVNPVA